MTNDNGINFMSNKIDELNLLSRSYADAITKKNEEIKKINIEIDQYLKKQDELFSKIKKYKEVLLDLEASNADNSLYQKAPKTLSYVNKSSITNTNHPFNQNVTPTSNASSEIVYAVISENSDEFIKFCDGLKKITFNPHVKNTPSVCSDGKTTYIKVSSILDLKGCIFNNIVVLPNADKNPDYRKIIDDILPLIKSKKF
jgi:thioester reductase-like protein